jgi:hypothetical protein
MRKNRDRKVNAMPHITDRLQATKWGVFTHYLNDFTVVPESRFIDGVQTHILAPLGTSSDGSEWNGWCKPGCKRSREYMLDYVRRVNDAGGVVTIDVALYRDGSFDPAQVEVLKYIGDHLT